MMALNQARLGAAILIAAAAALAGLATSPQAAAPALSAPSTVAGGPGPVVASDISALSARLRATGLFPAAIALHHDGAGGPDADGAASGDAGQGDILPAAAPPITALVREDRVWRLHAGGAITERTRLVAGDELFDGWRVEEISATRIVIRRGGEVRAIDVFDAPGDG